jgi:hypothetical protein
MIRYICGYRGTGKDTLCQEINNGFVNMYEIYTRLPKSETEQILTTPGTRVAFADQVKKLIAEKYGITIEHLNQNKEFYRSEIIDLAQSMKAIDPLFWVKMSNLEETVNPIITDFRFPNEVHIYHPIMIRVFRSEVPIHEVVSEIDLDEFETDLVLIPPGQHQALLNRFPQYANHTLY